MAARLPAMEGPADATPVMLLARGDQPTKETKLHNKIITQPSIMKLSYVLLALGAVASVGEARRAMLPLSDVPDKDGMVLVRGGRGWKKVHPVTGRTCWPGPNDGSMCKCGVGEICQQKSRFYKGKFCRKCVVPSEVDDDGFVQVRGGRGWLRVNPETGENCSPGPDDGPVCRCGPMQICTKLRFDGCAPNSCKSQQQRIFDEDELGWNGGDMYDD